ncbi:MAG: CDP-diacylglycerol--glycerol-3-phosphate 3-phosphatidyltransferase [Calditrichaeota bacterium]|nr:CDP-diacylglycerol--glycerol-3-phosphate 3-phosphatidyltransferase [Calditrichota bacterium]
MLSNIPNILTIIRILLTPVFAYFFISTASNSSIYAALFFFMAAATDWYDGYLARRINHTTRLGQFLDPIADKVLVLTAMAMFAIKNYVYWWMIIIIIIRDVLITSLRLYALQHGKSIITSSFAKWKTFIQMGFIFAVIIYINIPGAPDIHLSYTRSDWVLWTTISAIIVVLLTFASGIHYLYFNRSHLIEIFKRLTQRWFS